MNKKQYEAPSIDEIGSVRQLTRQTFDKVGSTPDGLGLIVGSLIGN